MALAAALGAGFWAGDRLQASKTADALAALAAEKADRAQAIAAAERAARQAVAQEVAAQVDKAKEVVTHAQAVLADLERDRAAVRPAVDRLRDAERAYWRRACGGGAAAPAAAAGSAPTVQAGGVHADVLGRLAEAAGRIGEFADRSHAAATACEALSR